MLLLKNHVFQATANNPNVSNVKMLLQSLSSSSTRCIYSTRKVSTIEGKKSKMKLAFRDIYSRSSETAQPLWEKPVKILTLDFFFVSVCWPQRAPKRARQAQRRVCLLLVREILQYYKTPPFSPSLCQGGVLCEKGGNNQITLGWNISEEGVGNPHERETQSPIIMADPLQEIGVGMLLLAQTRNTTRTWWSFGEMLGLGISN